MQEKPKNQKKIPKRITESYLHNSGLYYLERFSASIDHFRRTMTRKIDRSCLHHKDQDRTLCLEHLEKLINTFVRSGLLNDRQYTENMVHSLRRRGGSTRAIEARLKARGIAVSLIRTFLEKEESEYKDQEFKSALIYARKRRIGPFSTRAREDEDKKAMASLARAGFSFDISKRVLNIKDEEFTEEF